MDLPTFNALKHEVDALTQQASLELQPTTDGLVVTEYTSYSDMIHAENLAEDDITLVGDDS